MLINNLSKINHVSIPLRSGMLTKSGVFPLFFCPSTFPKKERRKEPGTLEHAYFTRT